MNDPAPPPKPKHSFSAASANPPKRLGVDAERFQHHLDQWDVSAEEKAAYLELVWQIVCQFVDLGYGIHPLNTAMQQSCGQGLENAGHGAHAPANTVDSKGHHSIEGTGKAAAECAAEREES